jgi:hypothetical protein
LHRAGLRNELARHGERRRRGQRVELEFGLVERVVGIGLRQLSEHQRLERKRRVVRQHVVQ